MVTICTTKFNIQQFYVLPTQCIYVFCVDLVSPLPLADNGRRAIFRNVVVLYFYILYFIQDDVQSPKHNQFSMLHTVVRTLRIQS
jgi:hypothetical protein